MSKISVSILQQDILWEKPEENILKMLALLDQTPDETEVIILPELWTSGFSAEFLHESDGAASKGLETLCLWCREHTCWAIAGSLPWIENSERYNRCWIINDAGNIETHYDKIHLFSKVNESGIFTHGRHPCIFNMRGFKCAVIICYDLRFPELARSLALAGVELLFVVAQWPTKKLDIWTTLLQAYATENHMFVVGCNRCGTGDVPYGGHSAILSPWGGYILQGDTHEGVLCTRIERDDIRKARGNSRIFKDRRAEMYPLISE